MAPLWVSGYNVSMSTVLEIEKAIEKLPRNEVFAIADWISKRFSDAWDAQIKEDVLTGALDHLVNEALAEYRTGAITNFPPDTK